MAYWESHKPQPADPLAPACAEENLPPADQAALAEAQG